METKCSLTEEATACYKDGLNCAQSVLVAFSSESGIDPEVAKKIASSFGGGLCQGDVCGAVAAAIMVLGLYHSSPEAESIESRKKVARIVQEFSKEFKSKHESLQCRELLSKGLKTLNRSELKEGESPKRKVCLNYVRDAAEILEQYLID